MVKNDSPKKILEVIKSSKNILIVMDCRFDYDALCSVLAFSDFLKQLHIKHKCVYGDELPERAKYIVDVSGIKQKTCFDRFDYGPYNLVVFLDTGNLSHYNDYFPFTPPEKIKILNIDHHAGDDLYGNLNHVIIRASTCSVLYSLFKKWRTRITINMANYLLLGLVSDTGVFHFSLVTSDELKTAGNLIGLGGNYSRIIEHLTLNETYENMKVRGIIYSKLKVDNKRKFAYSYLLQEDLDREGIDNFSVTLPDLIKALSGVDFVFIIKTKKGLDNWVVSLRSHSNEYDVLKIAKAIGGGGHKNAASGVVPFKEADTIEKVVEKVWKQQKR